MYYFDFDLEEYLYNHKYLFSYVKAYLKKNNILKSDFVKKLQMSYSNYCQLEGKNSHLKDEHVNNICREMNINRIDSSKLNEYSSTISRIYTKIYFKKNDDIDIEIKHLDDYILDNNILAPVFELFKLIINIIFDNNSIKRQRELYYQKYQELKCFEDVFSDAIETVFIMIACKMEPSSKIDFNRIEIAVTRFTPIKALVYHFIGSMYYYEQNYSKALLYELAVQKDFQNNYNPVRLIDSTNCLLCIYNATGEYLLVYDTIKPLIGYIFYGSTSPREITSLKYNFYYSLFFMKMDDELMKYIKGDKLDNVGITFLIFKYAMARDMSKLSNLSKYINDENFDNYAILDFFLNYNDKTEEEINAFINEIPDQLNKKIITAIIRNDITYNG